MPNFNFYRGTTDEEIYIEANVARSFREFVDKLRQALKNPVVDDTR